MKRLSRRSLALLHSTPPTTAHSATLLAEALHTLAEEAAWSKAAARHPTEPAAVLETRWETCRRARDPLCTTHTR